MKIAPKEEILPPDNRYCPHIMDIAYTSSTGIPEVILCSLQLNAVVLQEKQEASAADSLPPESMVSFPFRPHLLDCIRPQIVPRKLFCLLYFIFGVLDIKVKCHKLTNSKNRSMKSLEFYPQILIL